MDSNAFSRSCDFLGLRRGEDAAEARMLAAADPPAKLVQLRQAEPLAALDRHQRGVGHVDAHFDQRRRNQHLDFARSGTAPSRRLSPRSSCGRGSAPGERPPTRRWPAIRRPLAGSRPTTARTPRPAARRRSPAALRRASCGRTPTTARGARRRPDTCCTFCRPGGQSLSIETSRSPKSVIVTVRGMGVAVITR